ncbi:hypothetical protein ACMYSQ_011240 [Aspergillus niger]
MDQSSDSIALSILTVLHQINARLEVQDQQLRDIVSAIRGTGRASQQDNSAIITKQFRSFNTRLTKYPEGGVHLSEIEVVGPGLLRLLRAISEPPCPNHGIEDTRPLKFAYPFEPLQLYWNILTVVSRGSVKVEEPTLLEDEISDAVKADLDQLLHCLEEAENCRDSIHKRRVDSQKGLIRFEDLPNCFAPGTLVFAPAYMSDQSQVLEVAYTEIESTSGPVCCHIRCWYLDWNGEQFERAGGDFQIEYYGGKRAVAELPCYPLTSLAASSSDLQGVITRGRRLLTLVKGSRRILNDTGFEFNYCPPASITGGNAKQSERVIIDLGAFKKYSDMARSQPCPNFHGCACATCIKPLDVDHVSRSERRILLLTSTLPGYGLRQRRWCRFATEHLIEVDYFEGGLSLLALEVTVKQMLQFEMLEYVESRTKSGDVIRRRGQGVVIHIHGPPGVGKLSVAEILAEEYHLPLLITSIADVGLDPPTFKGNASTFMSLASRWNAIWTITEADDLLQARDIQSASTRHSLIAALLELLESYTGILIFSTSRVSQVDYAFRSIVKEVSLQPLTHGQMLHILSVSLRKVANYHEVDDDDRDDIGRWFEDAVKDWLPSGREIHSLVSTAVRFASLEARQLTLADIIRGYTLNTGRLDDWDLIRDNTLYSEPADLPHHEHTIPKQQLSTMLGMAWSIPPDARVGLSFLRSSLETQPYPRSLNLLGRLDEFTKSLHRYGGFHIVDWGWPQGRWYPQHGLIYDLTRQVPDAREQWEQAGLTFGLRRSLACDGNKPRLLKPWRRLLLCQGLSTVPVNRKKRRWTRSEPIDYLSTLPYITKGNGFDETLADGIALHLSCMLRRHQAGSTEAEGVLSFHIVFYELLSVPDLAERDSWDTYPFYGREDSICVRKSCFTMMSIPSEGKWLDDGAIHWTIVCLTPTGFWPSETSYADQTAPLLMAQSLEYVSRALQDVSQRWQTLLEALEEVDNHQFFQDPENLADRLFDDDSFSTSKRYFWAINFLHEFIHLIDDNIEQWEQYHKACVGPALRLCSLTTEHHLNESYKALRMYESLATDSCSELRSLRQAFHERLEQITVMRDGASDLRLFNASAVMESRASTRLGENVKLLTKVSIFFLPLSFCTSIWSVNETYSRSTLAIVAAVVALATYMATCNLNNLVKLIRTAYLPRRRLLVERMENDPTWRETAKRFKAFQRSNNGVREPSEWMVLAFSLHQLFLAVRNATPWSPRSSSQKEIHNDGDRNETADHTVDYISKRDPES